jgi:hypothetical protein
MAEVDWGTEDNQAKPKRRVPTWVWIGGGCCGVTVLAVVALTIGGAVAFKKMTNQEAAWQKLAQVLPHDEAAKRPDAQIADNFFAALAPGIEGVWQITQNDLEWQVTITHLSGDAAEEMRKEIFVEESSTAASQLMGAFSEHDAELGDIEVQGRSLRFRRFTTDEPDKSEKPPPGEPAARPRGVGDAIESMFEKSVVAIDVTPMGTPGLVVFGYARLGSSTPVPDEEVIEFLRPYHIGSDR